MFHIQPINTILTSLLLSSPSPYFFPNPFRPIFLHFSTKNSIIPLLFCSNSPQIISSYVYTKSSNLNPLPSSENLSPIPHIPIFTSPTPFNYILKSQKDMSQCCLTTIFILNGSLSSPFCLAQAELLTCTIFK